MIQRLRVKNFYSFRDELKLDFTVSGHTPTNTDHIAPIFPGSDMKAPKVVGLYGPNASGKTTLLKALTFISWLFQHSFNAPPENPLPCYSFNTEEAHRRPVEIEIEFSAPQDLTRASDPNAEQCRYSYTIVMESGGKPQPIKIVRESLNQWPRGSRRRINIFERDQDQKVRAARTFGLAGYTTPLQNVLRPNVSLVSTLVQLGHAPSQWLRTSASRIVANFTEGYLDSNVAQIYQKKPELLEALNREIQRLDLGIERMIVEQSSASATYYQTRFVHAGFAGPLRSGMESNGTRQFVKIFPTIESVLAEGGIGLVDEIDSSIHPLILPEIIRWFYDPERNPKNAQLWFTCQNAFLLEELSKEEVFFCEKDTFGGTTTFGLRDIRSVRRFDNYAKKYLGGAYGAVPHIG